MTTTCTITKAGRCDTYGRPLLVGQTYTSSDDEIKSLWQAGFCTVTGAPEVFEKVVYPYPKQVAVSGIPFVIPPGDGAAVGLQFTGSAGAFTLSSAILANLWNVLKGSWMYLPANFGGSSYPAGWYWAVFSSDTAGILYTDTYTSGTPKRTASPTAFPTNLTGWLTTTTAEITGPTGFVLAGGSMGKNGSLKAHLRLAGNITGSKNYKMYSGASQICAIGSVTTNPDSESIVSIKNQGSESLQLLSRQLANTGVGQVAASFLTNEYASIDTSLDQTLSISLQISTTTACAVLLHAALYQ